MTCWADLNINANAATFTVHVANFDSGNIDVISTSARLRFTEAGSNSVQIDAPLATQIYLASTTVTPAQTAFDIV